LATRDEIGVADVKLVALSDQILTKVRIWLTGGSLLANAWKVGFFCFALSAFLYLGGIPGRVTEDIIPLAYHPFDFVVLHSPILARRLTLPIMAHLLHLANRGIIVIPIVANFLTLVLLYYALALAMPETLAFLTVTLLSLTAMTVIGNTWLGMPDPISNLMGVACMASTNPMWIAVFAVIGFQTDERFAMMIPFILLWKIRDCASLKAAAKQSMPFLASILVALLATGLIQFLVVRDAVPISIYRHIFVEAWQQHAAFPLHIPLAIFFAFRWAWWLPIFLAAVAFKSRPKFLAVLTLLLIALESLAAMTVADMTRSMAQIFPGFVLTIYLLAKLRFETLQRWLPVAIMAMVVTPILDVWAIVWFLRYPAPVQLLRKLVLEGGGG